MRRVWFVSRQCYWGVEEDEANVVEIAQGGRDYSNPDMLVPKFSGEGEEYEDPIEAVEAAINIANQWRKSSPKLKIGVATGFTGGNTMPFEPEEEKDLREWAKKQEKSEENGDELSDD